MFVKECPIRHLQETSSFLTPRNPIQGRLAKIHDMPKAMMLYLPLYQKKNPLNYILEWKSIRDPSHIGWFLSVPAGFIVWNVIRWISGPWGLKMIKWWAARGGPAHRKHKDLADCWWPFGPSHLPLNPRKFHVKNTSINRYTEVTV